ncbi:MAG: PH domain-containing protein, partial [Acidobacteria bacterium]|nr:PH domain-containing protein [Acidobacteriota bacterium]MCA1608379.1 PH domain-containing protein [Acidobacteriota bacterium]
VLTVFGAFLLTALISMVSSGIPLWVGVVVGLALLLVPLFYHLRQKLVKYRLTDTTVEIDRGLISRTTQNIPLRRIQDVTVSASVFQRLLGFGDIVIDNASETGNRIVLDNIDSPRKYADLLLKQMRQLDR